MPNKMDAKLGQEPHHSCSSDDETTTDDGKRKKVFEVMSPFERSKKIVRSPKKKSNERPPENSEIGDLKNMFQDMLTEIREIKVDQRNFYDELKKAREEIKELRTENKHLQDRVNRLERNQERTERTQRKNNIVMKGIDFNNEPKKFEDFCKSRLQVEVTAESIQSFKTGNEMGDRKMSVIKLRNWEDKEKVMSGKSRLRGTQIYIDHDLTKIEADIQKKLREMAKVEREKGKTATVGYQKMFINGECWLYSHDNGGLIKRDIPPKN